MRLQSVYPVVALCLVMIVAVFAFAAQGANAGAEGEGAPRWEHLALTHDSPEVVNDDGLAKRIVGLGSEGWELVAVVPVAKDGTTVKTVFYFKRPK